LHFPVYFNIAGWKIPPHPVLESLAYFTGFRVYVALRKRERRHIPADKAMWILVAAVLGAAIGSKLLSWLEDPWLLVHHWSDPRYFMGGKTIVGGLLGGLIGVEWTKKMVGWQHSTGDSCVFPLIVGMCIGRVGCFLAGLPDHTYGTPTNWPIGIDFGDGIPRHPTQLYEILFLIALGLLILSLHRRARYALLHQSSSTWRGLPEGGYFQIFMLGYLTFRLAVEFIKPTPHPYWGLSNIQVACVLGVAYYVRCMVGWRHTGLSRETEVEHA
jgi:phosphatidylglycerol:prolipoprotein diacylglycerol transferase